MRLLGFGGLACSRAGVWLGVTCLSTLPRPYHLMFFLADGRRHVYR